jgi:hypothetical protein
MGKFQLYGYVACAVGAAALITGLLPQDKMENISAFMHERFGKQAIPTSQAIALPG